MSHCAAGVGDDLIDRADEIMKSFQLEASGELPRIVEQKIAGYTKLLADGVEPAEYDAIVEYLREQRRKFRVSAN